MPETSAGEQLAANDGEWSMVNSQWRFQIGGGLRNRKGSDWSVMMSYGRELIYTIGTLIGV